MAEELRQLHLLGATGQVRFEMYENRSHLVVPVVALMEGVIHAVNAQTPEFVSLVTLQKAAASWNGRPVTLGHPTKDGKQCSANDQKVLASHGIGTIFNSRVEGKKLLCEAWIDQEKARQLNAKMLDRLLAGEHEEVSVGAFVVTDGQGGDHGGKSYKASWLETIGDHLAFLPGGRGACSIAMGCGAHRAASHLVTVEGFEPVMLDLPILAFTTLADKSLDERITAVSKAVEKKWPNGISPVSVTLAYAQQVFDNSVIVRVNDTLYACPYDVAEDGTVTLGEQIEVKQTYVAAKGYECETCAGTGQVKDGDHQKDCPTCEGEGKIRAASGARHNTEDVTLIQAVHDHAMTLGAECDRANYRLMESNELLAAATPQLKAACSCQGESTMTKEQKAVVIAALVNDKHSGFKEGDVTFLETATDARLEEFKAAAEANKTAAEAATKQENDLRAAQAKLTVIEGKLKAAEAVPTEEEWLTKAPTGIKALLEQQKAQETETREALIKELKTAGANTEDELKAMPTTQLQTLAKYAKVQAPDFSGRGIPQPRAAAASDLASYTPPDPYAAELKTLREKSVN